MLTKERRTALLQAAKEAMASSYSPYSQYAVGAALLAADGAVFRGANIENAVYPLSLCAERVAIFKAVSEGQHDFEAIAVVTRDGGTPCGACRQVMAELTPNAVVLIADQSGKIVQETSVAELLPGAFGPKNLKSKA